VHSITRAHLAQGADVAMGWAETLPDGPRKAAIVTAVVNGIAQEDAARAAAWLEALGPSAYPDAAGQIAGRMEPPAGLEWIMRHGDEASRRRALPMIVSRWPSDNLDVIADWMGSYPESEEKDRMLEICAYRLQHKHPQQALEWAAQINEAKRRERASQNIVRVWRRRDPEAAKSFVGPE
jgi:hypothetical protein